MVYVTQFIFYGIPIAAVIFFIISLCRYLSAKRRQRVAPDSISEEQLRTRRILLIVSIFIAGIFTAVVIAFILLMFMAAAFM